MSKLKTKNINPIYWIQQPGLPWACLLWPCRAQALSCTKTWDLRYQDRLLDFFDHVSVDDQTTLGPFLEMYKTKKFFVYTTQIFTGVLFGLLALTLQMNHFFSFSIAILTIIAISGATHDTAADGVYLNELTPKLQAKFVGWQGAFYNIAKVLSGGVLVYMAGQLEKEIGIQNAWMVVMFTYGIIMVLLGLYNMRVIPEGNEVKEVTSVKEGFATLKDVIITFFQKKNIWFSLCFIVFYRFAEGQAIKIIPLFFKASRESGGLGLSTSQIGVLYGVFGSIAFVLGSIVAGYYVSNKGLTKKTLLILCAFFNLPFAAYAFLAIAMPHDIYVIASAVAVEYFGYGYGFVGLILFMMQNIAQVNTKWPIMPLAAD